MTGPVAQRLGLPILLLMQLGLQGTADAQIRLQSPKRLFDKLLEMKAITEESLYTIVGSTASFGTPVYGTILSGRAFYVSDPLVVDANGQDGGLHCSSLYCGAIQADIDAWKAAQLRGGLGHVVLFVDRGICTFAAKVEIAQSCGADAVVVVDHGTQGWTRETIRRNIIMSDDGKVHNITIPSVLISKEDGEAFEEEISAGKEQVLLEVEWRMPSQWPVAVNMWIDPGDLESTAFLQSLAPFMLRLGGHVRIQALYNIFSLDGGSEELCLSEGLYKKYPRLYCSLEPTARVLGLTGSEVVQESLLQLCLYSTTKVSVGGMGENEFSQEWWLYQQRLGDPQNGCSFSGQNKTRWGPECSKRVLSEVLSSGQLRAWQLCNDGEMGRKLLEFSKNNRGWTVIAMTINGARYGGQLSVEPVLRAICSSTIHPLTRQFRAPECADIVIDIHKVAAPWLRSTIDWPSLFFVLFLFFIACLGLTRLYQRYAKQQSVDQMQQHVHRAVQQQMQLYHRMDETPCLGKPVPA